jgi:hypothetical protein
MKRDKIVPLPGIGAFLGTALGILLLVGPAPAVTARLDAFGRALPESKREGVASTPVRSGGTPQPSPAGGPLFFPYVTLPVGQGAHGVAIGDVTGDGRDDLVAVQASLDSVYVFRQTPSGTLEPAVRYPAPITYVASGSVDIADLNDDGRLDVLVNLDGAVGVMLQTPAGLLSGPTAYPTQHVSFTNTYLVRSGDFNADGRADAASIDWGTQSHDADVFLQDASGSLAPSQVHAVVHGGYDDLEVGDVNGDGRDDIVVMSGQGGLADLGILLQNPGGGFAPAIYHDLPGEGTNGLGIGDVNDDGRDDVVVSYGGNSPGARIGVFLQDGSGNLAAPLSLPSLDIPQPVEVADLNLDGRDDVLTLHGGWLHLGVYLQGAGGLQPEEHYTIPYASHYGPHALAVGDLNHDTWPDVAIADYTFAGGVTLLYNTAPGATSILVSAVSAEPLGDRVELAWELGSDAGTVTVERSDTPGAWRALGTASVDAERRVRFTDRDVLPGSRYGYRLAFDLGGADVVAGEVWVDVLGGAALGLLGSQPNPSGGRLLVSLTLPRAEAATLELLDVIGRRIVSREVGALGAGAHVVDVTPRQPVAPGVYWLRLTQGGSVRTGKAVVL